ARLPRCTRCQSLAKPSVLEYWHIGETTRRLASVSCRRGKGANRSVISLLFSANSRVSPPCRLPPRGIGAHDGEERPDLVMIDLHMPEVDGYEAIARMRRDLTLATLPIVVLTAEEGPGVERRVLELGADDYLLKPFDPAVLLSRVHAVFRRIKAVAA